MTSVGRASCFLASSCDIPDLSGTTQPTVLTIEHIYILYSFCFSLQLLAPRARDKWAMKLQAAPLTNDSEVNARVFNELQLLRHFAAVFEQLKAGCNAADASERKARLTALLLAAFEARLKGQELREVISHYQLIVPSI